jgi:O-antigen ligase
LINLTGIVLLAWAVIQGIYIYVFKSHYPQVLVTFQSLISTRSLFLGRITSFAFEPSWLAQQLNLLFLPFWLAASLTRWSAFKFRIWKFSLENFLLVLGAAVLFVSSRVGTLALLVVLAFLGIYANILVARRLQKWTLSRLGGVSPFLRKLVQILLPVLLLILFLAVYALAAVVLVYGLSHLDYRLARFFKITTLAKLEELTSNIYYLFNYLAFAERFVYWVAGWRVFNLHPLLGVGLGNAGFYFQQVLPAYSWGLPEVMDAYYRASTVPNIKSLWVRLLAETGIVGFSSFGVWCLVCFKSAWSLRKAGTTSQRTIGWFGVFVLLSFLIEGFSTDTFALPYLWLSLGMLCATAALARCAPAGETTSGPSQESIPGKVG